MLVIECCASCHFTVQHVLAEDHKQAMHW